MTVGTNIIFNQSSVGILGDVSLNSSANIARKRNDAIRSAVRMGTTKKWSLKADDLKIVLNRIVGNRSYDLFSIKDDLKVIAKYISLIEQEDPHGRCTYQRGHISIAVTENKTIFEFWI